MVVFCRFQGLNGSVSGLPFFTELYCAATSRVFGEIDWKYSKDSDTSPAFDKLDVTCVNEIVTMGLTSEELRACDGGDHLTPKEFHNVIKKIVIGRSSSSSSSPVAVGEHTIGRDEVVTSSTLVNQLTGDSTLSRTSPLYLTDIPLLFPSLAIYLSLLLATSTVISSTEKEIVMIDCRNKYESDVGFFQEAIRPDMRNFSEWPEIADQLISDLSLR